MSITGTKEAAAAGASSQYSYLFDSDFKTKSKKILQTIHLLKLNLLMSKSEVQAEQVSA